MNRRNFLKTLIGTTVAVSVARPFVPNTSSFITDDMKWHDKRMWWRENFTIQSIEYAHSIGRDEKIARAVVTQNGRPDRRMYVAVRLGKDKFVKDEVLEEIKTGISLYAKRKGWVTPA